MEYKSKFKAAEIDARLEKMVNVTYAELVTLRDEGKLIAGQMYRMTDYETTTIQEGTQSAGHPFDLVLTALDNKTIDEKCSAIWSERDTDGYFVNSNLAAWDIWYCLNNDDNRFTWADKANGKGVIWRLVDEHYNDVCYDFKNILYSIKSKNGVYDENGTTQYVYTFNKYNKGNVDDSLNPICYSNIITCSFAMDISKGEIKNSLPRNVFLNTTGIVPMLDNIMHACGNQLYCCKDCVFGDCTQNNVLMRCKKIFCLGNTKYNVFENECINVQIKIKGFSRNVVKSKTWNLIVTTSDPSSLDVINYTIKRDPLSVLLEQLGVVECVLTKRNSLTPEFVVFKENVNTPYEFGLDDILNPQS